MQTLEAIPQESSLPEHPLHHIDSIIHEASKNDPEFESIIKAWYLLTSIQQDVQDLPIVEDSLAISYARNSEQFELLSFITSHDAYNIIDKALSQCNGHHEAPLAFIYQNHLSDRFLEFVQQNSANSFKELYEIPVLPLLNCYDLLTKIMGNTIGMEKVKVLTKLAKIDGRYKKKWFKPEILESYAKDTISNEVLRVLGVKNDQQRLQMLSDETEASKYQNLYSLLKIWYLTSSMREMGEKEVKSTLTSNTDKYQSREALEWTIREHMQLQLGEYSNSVNDFMRLCSTPVSQEIISRLSEKRSPFRDSVATTENVNIDKLIRRFERSIRSYSPQIETGFTARAIPYHRVYSIINLYERALLTLGIRQSTLSQLSTLSVFRERASGELSIRNNFRF